LRNWRSNSVGAKKAQNSEPEPNHLVSAASSLKELLNDRHIPEDIRHELAEDYRQIEAMVEKLEHGAIHIAAFGKVSAGKSSLLNALLGRDVFAVSALHGETKHSRMNQWQDAQFDGVHLIDTPGINELDGEAREAIAYNVTQRSDLVIFVVDGDLTSTELNALKTIIDQHRPTILALNKADRYSPQQLEQLTQVIEKHTEGLIRPEHIVTVSAAPAIQTVITIDADGNEKESRRQPEPDIDSLKSCISKILQTEGETLSAINAALFAGRMNDEIATRVAEVRRSAAEKITRTYSLAKGFAVAVNPIPVADLLAAAALDVSLVIQLSKVYGLPLSKHEGGKLIATIAAQMAVLMGTVWGVHLVSSTLKGVSGGLSVALTAGAQGALAYYATYVVGKAAEAYLVQGKSWGEGGPKTLVQDILSQIDRSSVLSEARQQILSRLKLNRTS